MANPAAIIERRVFLLTYLRQQARDSMPWTAEVLLIDQAKATHRATQAATVKEDLDDMKSDGLVKSRDWREELTESMVRGWQITPKGNRVLSGQDDRPPSLCAE